MNYFNALTILLQVVCFTPVVFLMLSILCYLPSVFVYAAFETICRTVGIATWFVHFPCRIVKASVRLKE